jgi:hypothetical protein
MFHFVRMLYGKDIRAFNAVYALSQIVRLYIKYDTLMNALTKLNFYTEKYTPSAVCAMGGKDVMVRGDVEADLVLNDSKRRMGEPSTYWWQDSLFDEDSEWNDGKWNHDYEFSLPGIKAPPKGSRLPKPSPPSERDNEWRARDKAIQEGRYYGGGEYTPPGPQP